MRIASYNVLASAYIRASYYPRVSPEFLSDAWRRPALVAHVAGLAADVTCLQEVEPAVYADFAQRGKDGVFASKGNGKPDGCASFFVRPHLASRTHYYRDGSGHLALLSVVQATPGTRIGIANTHLKWDATGAFALAQMRELCAQLDPDLPWVVCGDFNVTSESDAIAVLRQRGLLDAFAPLEDATCAPNGRARRIDFIFASPELRAHGLPHAAVHDTMPLPSVDQPSDHVAIVAELSAFA